MLNRLLGLFRSSPTLFGSARSGRWPKVRDEHLKKYPTCAACGGSKNVQVHHIKPFHIHPELELDPKNLVSLCEAETHGLNCHLLIGHCGNFKKENPNVLSDIEHIKKMLETK